MIQLTPNAASALQAAIAGVDSPVEGLRIVVETGGCSGYQYMMGLVSDVTPGDLVFDSNGLRVFTDANSASLLMGTTIDYVESLKGAGFTFDNPQAKNTCGCGKSFTN